MPHSPNSIVLTDGAITMMSDTLSTRQKVALCAALGTGVVVGATGLIVYQRLSQNVGLKVTGSDFSQEIASLTTHIERLRKDIECLRGSVNPSIGNIVKIFHECKLLV